MTLGNSTAKWSLLVFFGVFPLIFTGIGLYGIGDQHRKVRTYQPVEATVISTRIVTHSGNDGSTYSPEVVYQYTVGGASYKSGDVLPFNMSASHAWAQEIVGRFHRGQVTRAYYDPASHDRAFLLKRYEFFPYFFVLFPMIFITASITLLPLLSAARKWVPPVPQPDGWFKLKPASDVAARGRRALVVAGLWNGVGVLACGHYFSVATPPYETMAIVVTCLYAALGCIPVGMTVYYSLVHRHVGDARLFTNTQEFVPGGEVAVLVQQPVRTALQVSALNVSLVCSQTVQHGDSMVIKECHRSGSLLLENHATRPRDVLSGTWTVQLPADGHPSTPLETGEYPRYDWRFEVHTKIEHGPDYRGKFPFTLAMGGRAPSGAVPGVTRE